MDEGLKNYFEMMLSVKRSMDFDRSKIAYLGMEDYLMQHGHQFDPEPLTKEEMGLVKKATQIHECQQRECFYNCQMIAQCCPDFIYCEGVAVSIIPTHHAWLSLHGKVVDLTWRTDEKAPRKILPDRNLGTFKAPFLYFGIEIPNANWLRWWKAHRDCAVPVLDDWEKGWPIFQKGKSLETVVPQGKQLRVG